MYTFCNVNMIWKRKDFIVITFVLILLIILLSKNTVQRYLCNNSAFLFWSTWLRTATWKNIPDVTSACLTMPDGKQTLGFCLQQLILYSMCTKCYSNSRGFQMNFFKINSNIISTKNMPMSQSTTSSFITHSVHLHTYSQGLNRKCKLYMLPLVPGLVRLVNSALILRNYANLISYKHFNGPGMIFHISEDTTCVNIAKY